MSVFKCKMCGGDLEIADGVSVVECEYCGTKQTVPTSNDEELRNMVSDEYQYKTAQGIAEGIMLTLDSITMPQ